MRALIKSRARSSHAPTTDVSLGVGARLVRALGLWRACSRHAPTAKALNHTVSFLTFRGLPFVLLAFVAAVSCRADSVRLVGSDLVAPALTKALKEVVDPEMALDVVELGLVYRVEAAAKATRVRITMTSAACPVTEYIVEEVGHAVRKARPEVPADVELGYHLCYGSPADEHLVQPKNAGIMVDMTNAIIAGVKRPIQFFHMPVPKERADDAYFAPLRSLHLRPDTELYLGLVHHNDAAGNAARLATARRHARVDGISTECGMARARTRDTVRTLLDIHTQICAEA